MTAAKNSETVMTANNIGNSLLKNLNLPGLGGAGGGPSVMASMQGLGKAGGYQPKMFGAKAGVGSNVSDVDSVGGDSNRSFAARFGASNAGISQSIDIKPGANKFLSSSMTGAFGGAQHTESDNASIRNNIYSTPGMIRNPQSRKSVVEDDDVPNTDEFPGN